jgi:undecaprenyl-diphosphatase
MYILISIVLMLGGVLMLIAERFGKRTRDLKQMAWLDALIVGVWQIFAMIPGFSRSSVTISGGMLRNFNRADAARFSFLMSIPALLGAGMVALKDLFDTPGLLASLAAPLVVGFLSAAITGYLSIRWLLGYLKTRSLNVFVVYRFVFGGFCLIVGLIRLATQ